MIVRFRFQTQVTMWNKRGLFVADLPSQGNSPQYVLFVGPSTDDGGHTPSRCGDSDSIFMPTGARLRTPEPHAWIGVGRGIDVRPLTPTPSPSDGERVAFRAGEGASAGPPSFHGSGCLRLMTSFMRAPGLARLVPGLALRCGKPIAPWYSSRSTQMTTMRRLTSKQVSSRRNLEN